jgi:hypothetical protein
MIAVFWIAVFWIAVFWIAVFWRARASGWGSVRQAACQGISLDCASFPRRLAFARPRIEFYECWA